MLSKLIISSQRFILIIDDIGKEKWGHNVIKALLDEQNETESSIKVLPLTQKLLADNKAVEDFLKPSAEHNKWNLMLPPLSDLFCLLPINNVFNLLLRLSSHKNVQRMFLWATPQYFVHEKKDYLIGGLEYMSDVVLHLRTNTLLSLLIRKPGGTVSNKEYEYTSVGAKINLLEKPTATVIKCEQENEDTNAITTTETPSTSSTTTTNATITSTTTTTTPSTTFRIELDEDEMVARNALSLPYEKTSETNEEGGGAIIYTPDANDDFDAEDPDEDLNI